MTSTLVPQATTAAPTAPITPDVELQPEITIIPDVIAPGEFAQPVDASPLQLDAADVLAVDTPIAFGRIYAACALASTLLCLVVFTVMGVVWTGDWAIGLGGGAMMAVWGGPAFGAMFAGARVSAIIEHAHHD